MENMKYSILTTPINVTSINGVRYGKVSLEQMAEQINNNKIACTHGIPDNVKDCMTIQYDDNIIGICNSAKVTEQGLVVDINMINGNTICDKLTMGFVIKTEKTEHGDIINPQIMRAYTLLKEDSQWKSDN